MSAQDLLSRLEKVKQAAPGTWSACCPAHDDKNPSLGVRELDDGRVLVICRAMDCSAQDIVSAVGLEMDALFPPKPIEHAKPVKRAFPAHQILAALSHEAHVVLLAARDVANGKALDEASLCRLSAAVRRLEEGRAHAAGER